jgi:hypothetical protein
VAHVFQPGEVLLLTAHYLNTTNADLSPHVELRMHTVPRDTIQQEAGSFFFYNYTINVPPFSDVTVTRQCPMAQDVNLALLWSHMHARGVGFTATTSDAEATKQAGDLYESKDWSEPQPRDFPYAPPVTIHKGESITYACEYKNTTSNTYVAGVSAATNEMCILHGMYWPRADEATELCLLGLDPTAPPLAADAGKLGDAGKAADADVR